MISSFWKPHSEISNHSAAAPAFLTLIMTFPNAAGSAERIPDGIVIL